MGFVHSIPSFNNRSASSSVNPDGHLPTTSPPGFFSNPGSSFDQPCLGFGSPRGWYFHLRVIAHRRFAQNESLRRGWRISISSTTEIMSSKFAQELSPYPPHLLIPSCFCFARRRLPMPMSLPLLAVLEWEKAGRGEGQGRGRGTGGPGRGPGPGPGKRRARARARARAREGAVDGCKYGGRA